MLRVAALTTCLLVAAGCQRETFFCDTPQDCTSENAAGVCESTGYCSFPDTDCATGRRYGELASSGLAGTCVPEGTDTETSSTTATPATTSTTSGVGSTSTTSDGTTDAPATSEDETGTSVSTSSSSSTSGTGDPPQCCDASCSTCGESCAAEAIASIDTGESLAVSITGDTVVWSTGYIREVYTHDIVTEELSLLASLPHVITNIATDSEYVYYLSYTAGFVGRISLDNGSQSVITDAGDPFFAGFGQITVDDDNVYFACSNPTAEGLGGAFWAPKDPGAGSAPRRLGDLAAASGIGADDTHIYVADIDTDRLYRFERSAPKDMGTPIGDLMFPGPLLVLDDHVYATANNELWRFNKDGSGSAMLTSTGGRIEGITADDTHIYVTDITANVVVRVSMIDGTTAQIATSGGAWGIATSCDAVYWCENDSFSLMRQPK